MIERLILKDTEEKVSSTRLKECTTFAFGWDFPYTQMIRSPKQFFLTHDYSLVEPGSEQNGDIVLFSQGACDLNQLCLFSHVAILTRLDNENLYLSRLGKDNDIVVTNYEELAQAYGAIVLAVRMNAQSKTPYNTSVHA